MISGLGFMFFYLPVPGIPATMLGMGSFSANSFDLSWLVFNSFMNAGGKSLMEEVLKL